MTSPERKNGIPLEIQVRLQVNPDMSGTSGFGAARVPTSVVFEQKGTMVTAHVMREGEPIDVIGASGKTVKDTRSMLATLWGFQGDIAHPRIAGSERRLRVVPKVTPVSPEDKRSANDADGGGPKIHRSITLRKY